MKNKSKTATEKQNCKYCMHIEGYENFLMHCMVFNMKRPYGTRKCSKYKGR
jgi:hypothetical protein